MTLALPKVGLGGAPKVGDLYLADISVPPALFKAMDLEVPALFEAESVVAVHLVEVT